MQLQELFWVLLGLVRMGHRQKDVLDGQECLILVK